MSDILKIIVDAELKKKTSLEASLESIKSTYQKIEIEVELKGGKIKGLESADVIKKLQENIKALQGQLDELGKNSGEEIAEGMRKAREEMKKTAQTTDDLQKKVSKIYSDGTRVEQETRGNKFKKSTITEINGVPTDPIKITENYDIVIKKYEDMMKKSKEWQGVSKDDSQAFKDMLNHMKEIQRVSGKNAGKDVVFGSKEFAQQVKNVETQYNRLQLREQAYQKALKERKIIEEKLGSFKNGNIATTKQYKELEELMYGKNGKGALDQLKTPVGVEKRLERISKLFAEISEHAKNVQKNTDKLNAKLPNERLSNLKQYVDDDRSDHIRTEQYEKVKSVFENLNVEASDFTQQLKLADEELKEMEKHAKGLTVDKARGEALKEEARRNKLGTKVDSSNFDFGAVGDGRSERETQKAIQAEIYKTIKAIEDQTGKYYKLDESMIRVRKTAEGIYNISYSVDRGNRSFEDFNLVLDKNAKQLRDAGQSMTKMRGEMTQMQQLGQALSKVPLWAFATGIIYGTVRHIKSGFTTILEFDKAMTDLKKVANESREELIAFESDAMSLAKTLGKTANEVAGATAEFARLGYSLAEAGGLAQNALIYANVGDMGFEDASEFMISALKGFGVANEEAVLKSKEYSDIFNEVGNNYAISSAGIGEALKRSSAILHQSGNSIAQSVALITAANTSIQDPKVVGTALTFSACA